VTVFTVGHGARPVGDLLEELRRASVLRLVDVRTAPGSKRHPQFNRSALAETVGAAGIAYVWRKDLGGFRRPRPDSPHTALRNLAFRGYADHMDTPEFERALGWLIETSRAEATAVMCSETLWWRCHRRMIADALTVRGIDVVHLVGGRQERHGLHPVARAEGEHLLYDRDEGSQASPGDVEGTLR
jgi:uncharacterized protein (DUF488 family)